MINRCSYPGFPEYYRKTTSAGFSILGTLLSLIFFSNKPHYTLYLYPKPEEVQQECKKSPTFMELLRTRRGHSSNPKYRIFNL